MSDKNMLIPKIEEEMDKQFLEGFKAARAIIDNILDCYEIPPIMDDIRDAIEEEFENYRKDS